MTSTLEELLDERGSVKLTMTELTIGGFGNGFDSEHAHGCFWLPGHYIRVEGHLIEIRGLEYSVPFVTEVKTVEIVAQGQPMILVKAEDGSIDRLVTDSDLKELEFDESGNVRKKSR